MNKKTIYTLLAVAVCASLVFTLAAGPFASAPAKAESPEVWYGAWQAGPDLDTSLLGCAASDGFARYTGVYNSANNRIYFLGGRCENNNTTGAVFYFDLNTRSYTVTGAVMQTPVSNYQVVNVPDDGTGNGQGFYLVGGRTNTGAQTNAVQVYYPGNNTVATIATDPYPPSGGATRCPAVWCMPTARSTPSAVLTAQSCTTRPSSTTLLRLPAAAGRTSIPTCPPCAAISAWSRSAT